MRTVREPGLGGGVIRDERRWRGGVRLEAAGLFSGIDYSGVRDSAWDVPYHIVTTHTEVGRVEEKETTR